MCSACTVIPLLRYQVQRLHAVSERGFECVPPSDWYRRLPFCCPAVVTHEYLSSSLRISVRPEMLPSIPTCLAIICWISEALLSARGLLLSSPDCTHPNPGLMHPIPSLVSQKVWSMISHYFLVGVISTSWDLFWIPCMSTIPTAECLLLHNYYNSCSIFIIIIEQWIYNCF